MTALRSLEIIINTYVRVYRIKLAKYGIFLPYLSANEGVIAEEIAKPKKYEDPSAPIFSLGVHVKLSLSGSTQLLYESSEL